MNALAQFLERARLPALVACWLAFTAAETTQAWSAEIAARLREIDMTSFSADTAWLAPLPRTRTGSLRIRPHTACDSLLHFNLVGRRAATLLVQRYGTPTAVGAGAFRVYKYTNVPVTQKRIVSGLVAGGIEQTAAEKVAPSIARVLETAAARRLAVFVAVGSGAVLVI